MNQLTISKLTMSVYLNGNSILGLPLNIPSEIESLYWFNDKNGYINNVDGTKLQIIELPTWAKTCVDIYQANLPTPIPTPTPEEINYQNAQTGLYETDWTSIPDITDPAKCTPALTNQADFLSYRNQLRSIVLNPPSELVQFPVKPKAKWSA